MPKSSRKRVKSRKLRGGFEIPGLGSVFGNSASNPNSAQGSSYKMPWSSASAAPGSSTSAAPSSSYQMPWSSAAPGSSASAAPSSSASAAPSSSYQMPWSSNKEQGSGLSWFGMGGSNPAYSHSLLAGNAQQLSAPNLSVPTTNPIPHTNPIHQLAKTGGRRRRRNTKKTYRRKNTKKTYRHKRR
jgi:hypothetical protein